MEYQIMSIDYIGDNTFNYTLDNGSTIAVEARDEDTEPCNIGATDHTGYCVEGKLISDFDEYFPAGSRCLIVWDFGEDKYEEYLEDYDWYLESDETVCYIEFRG